LTAEETGLIVAMGEWALRRACADAARWSNDIRVAVNLSPVQFRNKCLVAEVANALNVSGLAPDRLELEITENVILGNNSQNVAILQALRKLGVRISLDDFGTGYAGLAYFRAIQFDKVKIDQSFVHEMNRQPECMAIIRAAIALGENLGLTTTAEGVESVEQMESLQREGCKEVQGFLFSVPQPNGNLGHTLDQIGCLPRPPIPTGRLGSAAT
jgi:EAL domain-containing protein (putative c-di-GMP-specific phosphodiesterase class I)